MAHPDFTTQDAATYKANIDESCSTYIDDLGQQTLSGGSVVWTIPAGCTRFEMGIFEAVMSTVTSEVLAVRLRAGVSTGNHYGAYNNVEASANTCRAYIWSSTSYGELAFTDDNTSLMSGIVTGTLIDPTLDIWAITGQMVTDITGTKVWNAAGNCDLTADLSTLYLDTVYSNTFNGGTARVRAWIGS